MLSNQSNIYMKKILLVTLIIFIGLSTIIVGFLRVQQERLEGQGFRVDFTKYSIAIFKDNTSEQILRISPQDDYYYQDSLKDHVINQAYVERKRNYTEEVIFLFGKIFGVKTFRWSEEGDNKQWHAAVSYGITVTSDGIVIQRQFSNIPKNVYAIGQAVVFCNTCLVVDNFNRRYLNGDSVSTQDFTFSEKHNLSALVFDRHQSIIGISRLRILSAQGKTLAELPVYSDQEVFFDQKYHLLELKTIMPVKRTNVLSQKIILK